MYRVRWSLSDLREFIKGHEELLSLPLSVADPEFFLVGRM
jgi:hypothetical protein